MLHRHETILNDLEVTVIAWVQPAIPPVPCGDPDHPAYSDPGDPGEACVEAVLLRSRTGKSIDIAPFLDDETIDQLAAAAYEDAIANADKA